MRAVRFLVPIVMVVALAACTGASAGQPAASPGTVTVGCDEFQGSARGGTVAVQRTVNAHVGDPLTIAICSNASTGFAWEAPVVADAAVVRLVGRSALEPTTDLVGQAGQEVFRFSVLGAGTTAIHFSYGQPWSGGQKDAWTMTVTVVAA